MKKRDVIIILSVLAVAIITFLFTSKAPADFVKITVDGKLYMTISLSQDQVIEIGNTNTAEVKDGKIRMKSASCPDKLCIHQGAISDSSKKIICLPNKVIIEALADSNIDTVVK